MDIQAAINPDRHAGCERQIARGHSRILM